MLQAKYNERDPEGVRDKILEELNSWKKVEIHIAVAGESGAGKSAFLNALRDVKSHDIEGAKESLIAETTAITDYRHPANKNLILSDLPGVGTDKFPRESYLETIQFDIYDFFIIISCKRFTENDKWLAEEVLKRGKRFYFVRSKFGLDVRNKQREARRNNDSQEVNVEELQKRVIDDCRKNLEFIQSDQNNPDIFIIDSHQKTSYDLEKLKNRIMCDTKQSDKREAFVYTLKVFSRTNIEKKREFLERRIPYKAFYAALAPSILSMDVNILREEQRFYMEQFGLDSDSLRSSIEEAHIVRDFKEFEEMSTLASKETEYNAILREMKDSLPFIKPVYNQVKFYGFSKKWLTDSLDIAEKCAIKISFKMAEDVCQ